MKRFPRDVGFIFIQERFKVKERFITDKSIAIYGDKVRYRGISFHRKNSFFYEPSEKGNNFFNASDSKKKPKKNKKANKNEKKKKKKKKDFKRNM